jgi:hypothetical protein
MNPSVKYCGAVAVSEKEPVSAATVDHYHLHTILLHASRVTPSQSAGAPLRLPRGGRLDMDSHGSGD